MVFSSTIFLFLFLPIVLAVYYLLDKHYKNTWLLMVSLFFFFWGEKKNIVIILVSIIINYSFGLFIHAYRNRQSFVRYGGGRIIISLGIIINLALLFFYKYLDFSINTFNNLFRMSLPLKNIALPIGISFFTFQGMTYIIDLYWGNTEVQKNPLKVALYISLFPQLIAGPIVRYKDVASQLSCRISSCDKFYSGIKRFVAGLAKKVIIANTVASVVDNIFANPYSENTFVTAWLGIICYTIQIYFDFSGYSDMAIGLGRMFGFEFLENFNYPYISKSITEFWRRWHISLSSFFKDYLYIPLGGNRKGNVYINLIIVFFATGLWHGASMNFVIWGLWHGLFIIIERQFRNRGIVLFGKIPNLFKNVYTLLVVIIGWVLFRSDNLKYAAGYLRIIFGLQKPDMVGFTTAYYIDAFLILVLVFGCILSCPVINIIKKYLETLEGKTLIIAKTIEGIFVLFLFIMSSILVITSNYNPFIYFRF